MASIGRGQAGRTRVLGRAIGGLSACAVAVLLFLVLGASASASVDLHVAAGTPTPQPPLSNSTGVASVPWSDPICPPIEGTQDTDPGVPPGSWSSLLEQAFAPLEEGGVEDAVEQVVDEAWANYLTHSQGASPPGFTTLKDAEDLLKGKAIAALLDQRTWAGIVQRIANVYKPTPANPNEFFAHLDQYAGGVSSVACDGNDSYRLFRSNGAASLWQLGPEGTWAKLTYDTDAPQPPENAQWTPVPGAPRSYIASLPTANPRSPFGMPLERLEGELTIGPDAIRRSCLSDESTTETANFQLDVSLYEAIQQNASWIALVPQARFVALLPKFSGDCATTPAVYTPWTSGPAVPPGAFAISNRASFIAAYTATPAAASIDRWQRNGTDWLPGVPIAGPTFTNFGDDALPRVAISGDGQTVAGCWLGPPLAGSGFESLKANEIAGIPPRYPEIFHFADGSVTYPSTGTTDPQGCSSVSLNETGDTVWYQQRGPAPNWFSSPTAPANARPVLTLPGDRQVEASGPSGAAAGFSASAQDGNGPVAASCSPASGAVFPLGSTTVSCHATNAFGTANGTFVVTVRDTTAPALTVPAGPLSAEASEAAGAPVSFAATASDLVDGAVPVSCSPGPGAVFPLGTTSVGCTASDQAGNTVTRGFDVVVVDSTPPLLSAVPGDLVVPASGPAGAQVGYATPTASDLVDGALPVSCSPGPDSTFPIGATTVRCMATDAHGNASSQSFGVTVSPIAIAVPEGLTVAAKDAGGQVVRYQVTATDELNGRKWKATCAPPSGTTFPLGVTRVDCRASDAHGTSTASFTVAVRDTKPPQISGLPGGQKVTATSPGGAIVSYVQPSAIDNVDGSTPVTCSPRSGSVFPVGKTVVTCSASDAAGNKSSRTFAITVKAAVFAP